MTKPAITIEGTIKRMCPICEKEKECNCFKINGKTIMICRDCTFKKYGVGKPDNKKLCEELADYVTPYINSRIQKQVDKMIALIEEVGLIKTTRLKGYIRLNNNQWEKIKNELKKFGAKK